MIKQNHDNTTNNNLFGHDSYLIDEVTVVSITIWTTGHDGTSFPG